jgi:predicted Zn finger-like uncharacterized protein
MPLKDNDSTVPLSATINHYRKVKVTKAYKNFYYECECPHCEATIRISDNLGVSGDRFDQECTECGKSFSTRCE